MKKNNENLKTVMLLSMNFINENKGLKPRTRVTWPHAVRVEFA